MGLGLEITRLPSGCVLFGPELTEEEEEELFLFLSFFLLDDVVPSPVGERGRRRVGEIVTIVLRFIVVGGDSYISCWCGDSYTYIHCCRR